MAVSPEEQRLNRIENKIDKLAETVVSLARAEEKLINLEEDIKTIVAKTVEIQTAQTAQDRRLIEAETALTVIKRVFWIVLTCAITTVVGYYVTSIITKASQKEPVAIHAPAKL